MTTKKFNSSEFYTEKLKILLILFIVDLPEDWTTKVIVPFNFALLFMFIQLLWNKATLLQNTHYSVSYLLQCLEDYHVSFKSIDH